MESGTKEPSVSIVYQPRNILRRNSDRLLLGLVTFLAGCLVTGLASYFSMWGAFIKDAATKQDVERMFRDHDVQTIREMDRITAEQKEILTRLEKIQQDNQDIRVKTGIEYGTPSRTR